MHQGGFEATLTSVQVKRNHTPNIHFPYLAGLHETDTLWAALLNDGHPVITKSPHVTVYLCRIRTRRTLNRQTSQNITEPVIVF